MVLPTQACGWRVECTDIGAREESALLGQGMHGHGAERTRAHDTDVDVEDEKVEGWGSET